MPFVIRFKVPDVHGTTSWDDVVHDTITFPNKDIEDFVILRSDGTPIYNLAVVSDDIDMRITLVMRGDDHISNTPKQILLYRALGHEPPRFAHVPMIHGLDGKKLSKRHGATAVADYQNEGILASAMVNFLALMGWSPGGDREVMTLAEMVSLFSFDGLAEEGRRLRHEEARVDERPAPEPHAGRRARAARHPGAARRRRHRRRRSRGAPRLVPRAASICSRSAPG